MSEHEIRAVGLSKWYGYVMGLNEVTCDISPGVTALLGPNGAGKSTFMNLVTGQLRPSQGHVTVLGRTPWNCPSVLKRIGYCSEQDAIFPGLSGRDFVKWACRLRGQTGQDVMKRAVASLERFGLGHAIDRKISTYSKGMRQRARLAAVDALDLDLYVLDEPTTGTDPVVRDQIVRWVRSLGEQGKAVLVSSHNLTEVEQMTDRIVLILGGRIRAAGGMRDIRSVMDSGVISLELRCQNPRPLAQALLGREDVSSATLGDEGSIAIITSGASSLYEELPGLAASCNAGLTQLIAPEANLAGLFRAVTARKGSN